MSDKEEIETLRAELLRLLVQYPTLNAFYKRAIEDTNTTLFLLKSTKNLMANNIADIMSNQEGGRHHEMNLKDIKELCKANQIKLSRDVDGKRVAYKKKELMTKLKRKKLL
jgi:hypothetical protein